MGEGESFENGFTKLSNLLQHRRQMVNILASWLDFNGYDVVVMTSHLCGCQSITTRHSMMRCCGGFDSGPDLQYEPDVLAVKKGERVILGEAVFGDSLDQRGTEQRWKNLSELTAAPAATLLWKMPTIGLMDMMGDLTEAVTAPVREFHVIVPGKCLEQARRQAERWGITVHQFYTEKIARLIPQNDTGFFGGPVGPRLWPPD